MPKILDAYKSADPFIMTDKLLLPGKSFRNLRKTSITKPSAYETELGWGVYEELTRGPFCQRLRNVLH